MLKLFHGSNNEIGAIDLDKCKPFKDFGRGFYLTTMEDQAEKMAKRVSRIYGGKPVVNVFSFDQDEVENDLNIRLFDEASAEWAIFVLNNRNRYFKDVSSAECNHDCKYDIVVGPVANDDLALLFRQFEGGLITVDTLVKGMKYKNLTNQYSFHTEKAIRCLHVEGFYYV